MRKILVIEDNLEVCENIAEILELSDYEVDTAFDGRQGLRKIMDWLPDLILCDIDLPNLSGIQILEILKKSSHTIDIPFIFITAKVSREEIRKGMTLGADDYITKPFDSVDLLDAVNIRLKKRSRIPQESAATPAKLYDPSKGMEALEEIAEGKEMRKYARREAIFKEGQPARYLYLIRSGRVKTYKCNRIGKEFVTDVFMPGDFFGLEALVFEIPHRDSAMSLERADVQLIPREDFTELLGKDRHFSALVLKTLAATIEDQEERMLSIAYDSVRKRIANALIKLSDHCRQSCSIKVLREDLSNMVGTAKESVSRTLSDFKNEKLIEIDRGRITILHPDKLANLPN